MKPIRLIVAAALFAVLGGVLWWSNKNEAAKEAAPPKDASPKILSVKESDIRQLEFDPRSGENTVIKKTESKQWQIVTPKPMPTDENAVGNLASAASSISSERVVDPNVTDLASYGLAPPVTAVKVTTSDGKTSTVLFGEESPTGSVYAKLEG